MNDDSEVFVISGTRRKFQELADGTLRVLVDIDPRFKADFHRLFPAIDTPCALAPLSLDFESFIPPPKQKAGALCQLSGRWCKDSKFQSWLSEIHGGQVFDEQAAAQWVRKVCRVESRSEIDKYETTEATFKEKIRAPFRAWMEKQIGEFR